MEIKKLKDLCIGKGEYGIAAPAEPFSESKYRYLRITDISDNGTLLSDDPKSVSCPGCEKCILQENDIVFARTGNSTGRAFFYEPKYGELVYAGFLIKFHLDDTKVTPQYMKYYTISQTYRNWVNNGPTGSTRGNMSEGDFADMPVFLPSRKQQDAIVNLFSPFDEKIDNNNAIAAELEGMAKDLYDYWFVQFDFPDENGKPYKSSGGKMVWNEELKREIPEGWEVSQLKDICFLRNGINYDKNEVGDADFKIANVRNITASTFLMDVNDFDVIHLKKEKAKQYSLKPEDIVIARSGTPGAIRLVQNPKNDTIFCGFIICCTPKVAKYRNYMAYTLKLFEGTSATKTGGSILQNVSQDTLNSLILCIPPDELIEKFNIMITSILEEIQNTINESRELTSLRDFLLPMLMNGQVKVKGA